MAKLRRQRHFLFKEMSQRDGIRGFFGKVLIEGGGQERMSRIFFPQIVQRSCPDEFLDLSRLGLEALESRGDVDDVVHLQKASAVAVLFFAARSCPFAALFPSMSFLQPRISRAASSITRAILKRSGYSREMPILFPCLSFLFSVIPRK